MFERYKKRENIIRDGFVVSLTAVFGTALIFADSEPQKKEVKDYWNQEGHSIEKVIPPYIYRARINPEYVVLNSQEAAYNNVLNYVREKTRCSKLVTSEESQDTLIITSLCK